MKQVLRVPPAGADRVVATIDLSGGWDATITKVKAEIEKINEKNRMLNAHHDLLISLAGALTNASVKFWQQWWVFGGVLTFQIVAIREI